MLAQNCPAYRLVTHPVGVHDAEGFLELLDGTLGEHGEDIASALLGFPKKYQIKHVLR